jgi:hypothetical protein
MRPPAKSSLVTLWTGVLLPPVAWMADFLARYALVRFMNQRRVVAPARLVTVLAIVASLVGALLCWRERRRWLTARPPANGDRARVRATLAAWGLGLAPFFLLLILAEAYPTLPLDPGEAD